MRTAFAIFFVFLVFLSNVIFVDGAEERDDAYSMNLVKSLLQHPAQMGAGFSEKQVNRLGDRVSIALIKILGDDALRNPEKIKTILPLIRSSFLYPDLISIAEDRKPKVTLFLLRHLERDVKALDLKREISQLITFIQKQTAAYE